MEMKHKNTEQKKAERAFKDGSMYEENKDTLFVKDVKKHYNNCSVDLCHYGDGLIIGIELGIQSERERVCEILRTFDIEWCCCDNEIIEREKIEELLAKINSPNETLTCLKDNADINRMRTGSDKINSEKTE